MHILRGEWGGRWIGVGRVCGDGEVKNAERQYSDAISAYLTSNLFINVRAILVRYKFMWNVKLSYLIRIYSIISSWWWRWQRKNPRLHTHTHIHLNVICTCTLGWSKKLKFLNSYLHQLISKNQCKKQFWAIFR